MTIPTINVESLTIIGRHNASIEFSDLGRIGEIPTAVRIKKGNRHYTMNRLFDPMRDREGEIVAWVYESAAKNGRRQRATLTIFND